MKVLWHGPCLSRPTACRWALAGPNRHDRRTPSFDGGVLAGPAWPEGERERQTLAPRRRPSRGARRAGSAGTYARRDRRETRREHLVRSILDQALRATPAACDSPRRDQPCHRGGTEDASSEMQAPWLDGVCDREQRSDTLPEVPDRARLAMASPDEGTSGGGGWREMRDLRLRSLPGRASVSSSGSEQEVFRAIAQRENPIDRQASSGGSQVRSAMCELPRRGGGGPDQAVAVTFPARDTFASVAAVSRDVTAACLTVNQVVLVRIQSGESFPCNGAVDLPGRWSHEFGPYIGAKSRLDFRAGKAA